MTHTCLEQSKQLLKLGLENKSADLVYCIHRKDCTIPWEEAAKDDKNVSLQFRPFDGYLSDYALPCWSAEALLQLLPVTLYNDEGFETHKLKLSKDSDDSYTVSYSPIYPSDYADDEFSESGKLLDVLIKAYNWLLEYNYL